MAIDLNEPLIPLTQIPAQPFVPRRRGGSKLNVATAFRWAQRGVRGIKLETISFGGTRCTTRTALLEFFRALAPDQQQARPLPRTPGRRARESARAAAELAKAGI